jgi:hypothetical protein
VKAGTTVDLLVTSQINVASSVALVLKAQWAKLGLNVNVALTSDIVTDFYRPGLTGVPKVPAAVGSTSKSDSARLSFLFTPGTLRDTCNFIDPKIQDAIPVLQGLKPDDPGAYAKWKEVSAYIASVDAILPFTFSPALFAWNKKVGGVTADNLAQGGLVGHRLDLLYIKASA